MVRWKLGGLVVLLAAACENVMTAHLTPVPPVHVLPADVQGTVVLIDKDPIIETRDAVHVRRANEQRVPQGYRAALEKSLTEAGFRITARTEERHDLVARLAIAVSEDGDEITQIYRCGLTDPGGGKVAQIDWTWPKGTYVDTLEVFPFATHNLATDVVSSPRVLQYLRRTRGADGGPSER